MKCYHGTTKDKLPFILHHGLMERGTDGGLVCFTVADEDVPATRAYADPELDVSALELASLWGDGTVVLVEAEFEELEEFFEDEGDGGSSWEARIRGPVLPERLVILRKE